MVELMNANREYLDYVAFPYGLSLSIPVIDFEQVQGAPPWKVD